MGESRHRSIILLLCCLAQFIVILDVAIVSVALPSMARDLQFIPADLHWVVNAYTLTFGGFLLLGGRTGDLVGRREVFVVGLMLFTIASLIAGAAQSKEMLIGARALQGIGGAAIAPTSLAILMTTFSEGAERNRALGLWGAMGGVGGASGVLLGGILTETLSWRWVFLINIPICAAMAAAALAYVSHVVEPAPDRKADVAGAFTVTAGLVVITYGIVGTEAHGWGSLRTLATLAGGLALIALFVLIEARLAKDPLVPLRIFRSRAVSGSWLAVFCLGAAGISLWYVLALFSQDALGYSPLESGLMFLPMTLTVAVASRIAAALCSRLPAGIVLAGALATLGIGMVGLSRLGASSGIVDLLAAGLVCAIGIGGGFVAVTVSATTGVAGPESGLASGLVNAGRQIGGSIGIAVLTAVAAAHTASLIDVAKVEVALSDGYARAMLVGSIFAFAGALVSVTVLRGSRPRRAATPGAVA